MVHHLGEIRDRRLGVQAREHVIAPRVLGELRDAGAPVVEVAEHDRLGGTGLGARRDDFAVPQVAVLETGAILRPADALDAEGALLHHASAGRRIAPVRSEEHTSELQSRQYLVCRLLLEKKKKKQKNKL